MFLLSGQSQDGRRNSIEETGPARTAAVLLLRPHRRLRVIAAAAATAAVRVASWRAASILRPRRGAVLGARGRTCSYSRTIVTVIV